MDYESALNHEKRRCEEKLCNTPKGTGTVERVYQRRGMANGVFGCKVIMESGAIKYFDILDVDLW